uniref:Uncharacterized protein n=1 Tax=Cyprinodon variegatus TaxID=28743 RepID=A0A3Q2ED34_CYPVA
MQSDLISWNILMRWGQVHTNTENAIEDKLDRKQWLFVSNPAPINTTQTALLSAHFGNCRRNKSPTEYRSGPLLIIFMIGGLSHSEMCSWDTLPGCISSCGVGLGLVLDCIAALFSVVAGSGTFFLFWLPLSPTGGSGDLLLSLFPLEGFALRPRRIVAS